MYKVLDLFCGCGGMSWGLHKDGFKIIGGIDLWDIALETFQYNHPESKAMKLDISEANPKEVMEELNIKIGELDVMVGGPPCQGFSKNTPASSRFLEDPRNQLYKSYMKYVEMFYPKIVIIENVAEIFNAYDGVVKNEIISTLGDLGYKVEVQVINMAKYGIPQKRRRCFFFASRVGKPRFPKTNTNEISAWDAISDLPIVQQGEEKTMYEDGPFNEYQEHMRKDAKILANHYGRVMSKLQNARIEALLPGQGLKDLPQELSVKGGYSGAYGRLDYNMISPTITRWVFHIGSGRFSHPREVRGITMREAARIQSFSDEFHFLGTNNEQAGQIGNAVPPLFMEKLGKEILHCLNEGVKYF